MSKVLIVALSLILLTSCHKSTAEDNDLWTNGHLYYIDQGVEEVKTLVTNPSDLKFFLLKEGITDPDKFLKDHPITSVSICSWKFSAIDLKTMDDLLVKANYKVVDSKYFPDCNCHNGGTCVIYTQQLIAKPIGKGVH